MKITRPSQTYRLHSMTLKGHQLPNASCEIAHCNLPKPAPFVSFPPTRHYHTQATACDSLSEASNYIGGATNAYNENHQTKTTTSKIPPFNLTL